MPKLNQALLKQFHEDAARALAERWKRCGAPAALVLGFAPMLAGEHGGRSVIPGAIDPELRLEAPSLVDLDTVAVGDLPVLYEPDLDPASRRHAVDVSLDLGSAEEA